MISAREQISRTVIFDSSFFFSNPKKISPRYPYAARCSVMISNGLGTIANIILDPVLILGFGMGVAGAAAATVIGNGISFLYLLWYVTKKQKAFSLNIRDLSLKKEVVLPIVTLGLPLACSTIMMSVSHMFMNHILAGYGSVTVAASGGAGKVSMVVSMAAMGLCMGLLWAVPAMRDVSAVHRESILRDGGGPA